ncbi:pilin [Acinetobacter sp. NCu2D-2]|uniref:pilin n=1 Tax=Acinetobacter sp. NCu2D-2 TaxID=1608473 RepID=UPI001D0CFB4A
MAKAQFTEVFNLLSGYKNEMHEFYSEGGSCAGIQAYMNNVDTHGHYIDQISIQTVGTECALVFHFKSTNVVHGISGKQVNFLMKGNSYNWLCYSPNISERYLPSNCEGV